ncbi:MAG: serine O-acetyltransferase [Halobacteriota archaeon]
MNVFGPGLLISHWGTIVVHPNAKVGANCELQNDTHIALKTGDGKAPKIGDNVFIGAGARILGDIELADWVAVGANVVVTKSFTEPHITIAGIPARKIGDRKHSCTEERCIHCNPKAGGFASCIEEERSVVL